MNIKLTLLKFHSHQHQLINNRYRVDRKQVSSTSWRCSKSGCKGRLITDAVHKRETTPHNHTPTPGENEVLLVKNAIKKSAMENDDKPRTIIQSASSNMSVEASAFLQCYMMLPGGRSKDKEVKHSERHRHPKLLKTLHKLKLMKLVVRPIKVNLFCFGTPEMMIPIEYLCLVRTATWLF